MVPVREEGAGTKDRKGAGPSSRMSGTRNVD